MRPHPHQRQHRRAVDDQDVLPPPLEFGYVGRPERASPGEGYPAAHTVEQNRIIRTALDLSVPVSVNPAKLPGER